MIFHTREREDFGFAIGWHTTAPFSSRFFYAGIGEVCLSSCRQRAIGQLERMNESNSSENFFRFAMVCSFGRISLFLL